MATVMIVPQPTYLTTTQYEQKEAQNLPKAKFDIAKKERS